MNNPESYSQMIEDDMTTEILFALAIMPDHVVGQIIERGINIKPELNSRLWN